MQPVDSSEDKKRGMQVNWVHKLEGFLEAKLEGWFRQNFPTPLKSADLAKQLVKQMYRQRLKSVSRIYVPNAYLIFLNPQDFEQFKPYQNALAAELVEYLERKAGQRNFQLPGKVRVDLAIEPALPQGQITVSGQMQEECLPPNEQSMENTLVYQNLGQEEQLPKISSWVLEIIQGMDVGKSFHLQQKQNLIGRNVDAEISLLDPKVSRNHAQLEVSRQELLLKDLDSTNGTLVNERPVKATTLAAGDQLQVGNTILLLKEAVLDQDLSNC